MKKKTTFPAGNFGISAFTFNINHNEITRVESGGDGKNAPRTG
jgi:hypothetical protein